ncbi:Zn(II)2Cys6 transcription factor [Aspergillus stella-maris]|uniref:Zn(II)2Cys6 transcription factor n=1 Tax=Aspergillus stella-maris TaxID=1810926 RepID=UPI003CCE04CE
MLMDGKQPAKPARAKRETRSRKGCPECRSRKIKCDEKQPECGQCLKSGRACRIIDSIFKPHEYTFKTTAVKANTPSSRHEIDDKNVSQRGAARRAPSISVINDQYRPETHSPMNASQTDSVGDRPILGHDLAERNAYTQSPALPYESPHLPITTQPEDTYQDRCEIAFFLRHFSEGPGQWMDLVGERSYFSYNAVVFAHWSPLVRYAACALGAKQLGQTRNPELQIRQTNTQSLMMRALIDTKLGFTWYGAKYYEKAIQLLSRNISKKDLCSPATSSPNYIYGLNSTPKSTDHSTLADEADGTPYQILAACILCQYEDVNATIRAWTGHLDGAFRLLRPHLTDPAVFQFSDMVPQPTRALDAIFWYLTVNDMLNAFVIRSRTRIDPDDLVLWRTLGLPLDDYGRLAIISPREAQLEVILFKSLIRLMCQLLNADVENSDQWLRITEEFDRWQSSVPSSFYVPITWPPADASPTTSADPFCRETWFPSDICAITLAFYHMSRMILLANRPMGLFEARPQTTGDIPDPTSTLQQDLRKHAMEIIPIMHAMPSERVQKYMLQPLYVAGRSLTEDKERSSLLRLMRAMGDDFGLFTDYRVQNLCEEWGIPYSGIDRRDGHGIFT